jgi:hypothetical protein
VVDRPFQHEDGVELMIEATFARGKQIIFSKVLLTWNNPLRYQLLLMAGDSQNEKRNLRLWRCSRAHSATMTIINDKKEI